MKHLSRVTVATAVTSDGPDLAAILDAIFKFVLDVMDLKGKGTAPAL